MSILLTVNQSNRSAQAMFVETGRMIFLTPGIFHACPQEQATDLILHLHLSYFCADMNDFYGFADYHGGAYNPFVRRLGSLLDTCHYPRDGETPKVPLRRWDPFRMDKQLRDLICQMTYMDPRRRITAREALQHPWFAAS
jgi:serine/threonine protein kinase